MPDNLNLILQSLDLKSFKLSNPTLSAAPGRAIVYAGKNQPMAVVFNGEAGGPNRAEVFLGRFSWCYEIDVSEKHLNFDEKLLSSENIQAFAVSVQVVYSVHDPIMIVTNRVANPELVIRPAVTDALAEVVRRFSLEQLKEAQLGIRRLNLADKSLSGLKIRQLFLKLTLTEGADKIVTERALQRAMQQNDLDKARHEAILKDQKAARAQRLILEGPESLLADHLADNPGDALSVAKMLISQRYKNNQMLRDADNINDPLVRDAFLERLTGKPAPAQLMGGSPVESDDPLEMDPIVEDDDDDDDLPPEFRRD
jgi:hypothetical protein